MKNKITSLLLLTISVPTYSGEYIIRIDTKNNYKVEHSQTITENISDWIDKNSTCDNWTPSPNTIESGLEFNQTRNCVINQEATKSIYHNGILHSQEILTQTIEKIENNVSTGTKVADNLVDQLPISSFSHSSAYTYGPVLTSNLAFDNDNNTRWETNARTITNQFISIDMLKNVKVTKFDYNNSTPWPGRSPRDFSIQASDNGSNWINYYTGIMPNSTYTTISFDISGVPNSGHRYWRVYFNNNYGDIYAIVASEINLYGY